MGGRIGAALLGAIAAAAVLAGAGSAGRAASASALADIVFQGPTNGSVSFGGSSAISFGDEEYSSISVLTQPSLAPLPERISIQVPAGYTFDLDAKPGEIVASASIAIVSVDSPSFATAAGDLTAADPAAGASDPAVQACAPGLHAAVWTSTISLVGQKIRLVVTVDPGGPAGVAYTVQACASGLPPGTEQAVASIRIDGIEALHSPKASGSYLWHAYITQSAAPAYELQALVPFPESLTMRGRYDTKKKVAILSGRVMEAGRPVGGALVDVEPANGSGRSHEARTKPDGTFTLRAAIAKSTDFEASVRGELVPCTGTSSAPGGCLGRTTAVPGDGYASVWVSVRGGAVRAIRQREQRLAERATMASTDLPDGFIAVQPGGVDACQNRTHESDLVIRGEAGSSIFVRYRVEGAEIAGYAVAFGLNRVYAAAGQARAAFERDAVAATATCELRRLLEKKTVPKLIPYRFTLPSGARMRGFRSTVRSGGQTAQVDFAFLQRRSSTAVLTFIRAGVIGDAEHRVVTRTLARMS